MARRSAIADALGCEVTTDDRLRERMNWNDPEAQRLDEFLAEWQMASADRSFVPRFGDSSLDAAHRFIAALREIATSVRDESDVVVVSHGGVTVDVLRSIVGDERIADEQPLLIEEGVSCCSVTHVYWSDDEWTVLLPTDNHLAEPSEHRPT